MAIDTTLISQLREMTGAGVLDAKKALDEAGGDVNQAAELLRKKGAAKAVKKASRETKEGLVHAYIHGNGKIGAMVEVLCETDFVARNEAFKELCHELALQVSATDPEFVRREEVPAERVEKERAVFQEEAAGKPADVMEKIVEGKLNKFYGQICLLEQEYIKDDSKTVQDVVNEAIAKIGENIQVGRIARLSI